MSCLCLLQVLKKATIRKEQEPDFEEKRFNVTIGEDERDFDKENEFFRERSYRVIREYVDLFLSFMSGYVISADMKHKTRISGCFFPPPNLLELP